ncbi:MAG: ATP-dependent helicase RecG, partial [Micromonosporaceae bacterium]|nr:ATP-dependent helicase RecG [Micromonosporaceae bacterium]
MTTLDMPLAKAPLVGPTVAKTLAKAFEMNTMRDLIYHFPRRYAERGELTDIASLTVGEDVTILAQVVRANLRSFRNRPGAMLEAVVGDGSRDTLTLTFFGKNTQKLEWRLRELSPGKQAMFAGTVSEYNGKRQLTHPEYVLLERDATSVEDFASALIPVYPATKDLRSWQIAKIVEVVLPTLEPPDPMPSAMRVQRGLMDLPTALREIHRPATWKMLGAAKKRLKWDEAFAVQVSLVQRKMRAADWPAVARPARPDGLLAAFDAALPYVLTQGQVSVGKEIAADLSAKHPMHRLLQGEV